MCVIIAKDKGARMPSMSILRAAWLANPHGIGFVSTNGYYWRGMSFNEFKSRIKCVGTGDACIIHFRYATHGSHKVSNCHPFRHNDLYFAHNGVLPVRTYNDMTDSETVFRNRIVPVYEAHGIGSKEFEDVVLENIHTSRFAFLKGQNVFLFGPFRQINGVWYSNTHWMPYRQQNYDYAR